MEQQQLLLLLPGLFLFLFYTHTQERENKTIRMDKLPRLLQNGAAAHFQISHPNKSAVSLLTSYRAAAAAHHHPPRSVIIV
jgi:hypothetical protein